MNIGGDIGYTTTKFVRGDGDNSRDRVSYPSVVGTPTKSRFGLGDSGGIVLLKPYHVLVGEGAIAQSRFLTRREDRNWYASDTWNALAKTGLALMSRAASTPVRLVTGVPVSYFDDKDTVQERLMGEHEVQLQGRDLQRFIVTHCNVVPQPFGSLLNEALDRDGKVIDVKLERLKVGTCDVGSKTTNLQYTDGLIDVARKSVSIETGAWDLVRMFTDYLDTTYPGHSLRDHDVIEVIKSGKLTYYGAQKNLRREINDMISDFAEEIIGEATQLWNGGADLYTILITGGGAHLVGSTILDHFGFGKIVDNPVFGNALGYLKFARYLWGCE